MKTLAEIVLRLAREITDVLESTATNGSTTTLVDSGLANIYPDDHFNQGTIHFLGGALEGTSTVITDYASNGTFTFAAQTSSLASGVNYAAWTADYPRYGIRQSIISQLHQKKNMVQRSTIIDADGGQEYDEYDDPIFAYEVLAVECSDLTEEPYDWFVHYNWNQSKPPRAITFDPGTEPDDGDKIRITYVIDAAIPEADDDMLDSGLNLDVVLAGARLHLLRQRYMKVKNDDPTVISLLNEAKTEQDRIEKLTLRAPAKTPRLARW